MGEKVVGVRVKEGRWLIKELLIGQSFASSFLASFLRVCHHGTAACALYDLQGILEDCITVLMSR